MRKTSMPVCLLAAGSLVIGSMGLAGASPHRISLHSAHGATGENPDLLAKRATGTLPKLVGIVNADRDLEISDRTPSPGRYKIVVRDSTTRHNWHLYGNGKSIATKVRAKGRWVFKIRLTAGNYRVVCDPHNDAMEFDLIVG
jgi:hypothetical protein